MNVSVFGLGYVGCVSAACLARDGHRVIGVDVNAQKVADINQKQSPIIEPGLQPLIAFAVDSEKLTAQIDPCSAVWETDISLICVGTPSNHNGSLKLNYVENVSRQIGEALARKDTYHVVVVRSTVLPTTVNERVIPLLEQHSGKQAGVDFGVCMNPEFLREGSAIRDYDRPSLIVIGELDERSGAAVEQLYANLDAPVERVPIKTAEMVKYANNLFHGLKVTFANEIGVLAKAQGIDGRDVMELVCRDTQLNISTAYMKPGFAFGGSCLPKDSRAMIYRAKQLDVDVPLLGAVLYSNASQIERGIQMIEQTRQRRIGFLGLSFKADTDDVRESPVVAMVERLVGRGYQVTVHDENVEPERLVGSNKQFLAHGLPHIACLMRDSAETILAESDVIVIANNSQTYHDIPNHIRPDQTLIDLVGKVRVNGNFKGAYNGICW